MADPKTSIGAGVPLSTAEEWHEAGRVESKIEWSGELSLADLGRKAVEHLTEEEINAPDPEPRPEPVQQRPSLWLLIRPTQSGFTAAMTERFLSMDPVFFSGPDEHSAIAKIRFALISHLYKSGFMEWNEAKAYIKHVDFKIVRDKN